MSLVSGPRVPEGHPRFLGLVSVGTGLAPLQREGSMRPAHHCMAALVC